MTNNVAAGNGVMVVSLRKNVCILRAFFERITTDFYWLVSCEAHILDLPSLPFLRHFSGLCIEEAAKFVTMSLIIKSDAFESKLSLRLYSLMESETRSGC